MHSSPLRQWDEGRGSHHPDYDPEIVGSDVQKASRATVRLKAAAAFMRLLHFIHFINSLSGILNAIMGRSAGSNNMLGASSALQQLSGIQTRLAFGQSKSHQHACQAFLLPMCLRSWPDAFMFYRAAKHFPELITSSMYTFQLQMIRPKSYGQSE